VLDTSGHLVLESVDTDTQIEIGGSATATLSELGLSVGIVDPTNLLTQNIVSQDQDLTIQFGSATAQSIVFGSDDSAGEVSTLAELETKLGTITGGTASIDTDGNITIASDVAADDITLGGTVVSTDGYKNFGLRTTSAIQSNQVVIGDDVSAFLDNSIGGGAVTAYDSLGSPVNIQLRWAKTDSASLGDTHADTWNLFYEVDSDATGTDTAWQNAGVDYTFNDKGELDPAVSSVTLDDVTVDGVSLGSIDIVHGSDGVTQFADPDGGAQVNLLQQNGFAAGSLQEVSVNDKGRVVGSYSNGRTIELAEITLANFSGANYLKRIDGGAFEATEESGAAVYGAAGKIVSSSLEGSNTDIADEFTKLIVTQQAYSANTRVISTGNQMAQDLLNMLR
jgi:flagellar hook protein FlgE